MNFRDLEYLVAVADLGHFGQAAAHCHVSQSALSLQLQKLEAELGVQLIERTSRRVVVASAGRPLVERARGILQARQELLDAAALELGQMPATITVGMIPTIAPYFIGTILGAMSKAYGGTLVRAIEDVTKELVQGVARGELDAAIIATPTQDSLLEETPLFKDEMLLAIAATHPLAKKKTVALHDVVNEPLLLLKDGHCLSDQTIALCTAQSGPTQRHSIATSIETLKALIRAGQGVGLIPRLAVKSAEEDASLRYLPVIPSASRQIRILTRKTSRLGRLLVTALAKL